MKKQLKTIQKLKKTYNKSKRTIPYSSFFYLKTDILKIKVDIANNRWYNMYINKKERTKKMKNCNLHIEYKGKIRTFHADNLQLIKSQLERFFRRSVNFKDSYKVIKDNRLDLVDLLNTVVGKDKWFMINRTYTKVVS